MYMYLSSSWSPFLKDENVVSRTTEVLACIEALEEGGQNATLPFLPHMFEEVGCSCLHSLILSSFVHLIQATTQDFYQKVSCCVNYN